MAIVKDLGMVTAYAYAVAGGYEGTEAEFTELLGQAGITLEQLENLTAVATTLAEGSEATASYANGVLIFGIPKGDTGPQGEQGEQGIQGETGNGIETIEKTGTAGLVDTYTITFTDGATTTFEVTNGEVTPEQMAEAIAEALQNYARKDGTYDYLTAGMAEQLLSDVITTDTAPYLFRKTGADATRERPEIVGGSVVSNQLVDSGTTSVTLTNGHKYYTVISGTATIQAGSGSSVSVTGGTDTVTDLTQMFGTAIADYAYTLEQATAGAGIAWLKSYGFFADEYIPYNAGTFKHVEGLVAHETVGFNQWDEEWVVGGFNPTTGENTSETDRIRSKNNIPVLPDTTYYVRYPTNLSGGVYIYLLDAAGTLISSLYKSGGGTFTTPNNCFSIKFNTQSYYGGDYKNDICINLSNPARNGQYKPYVKHTYPLDSTVTLRGPLKLTDGKIYYNGDVYPPSGVVNRRYALVDLGTLTWTYDATNTRFYTGGIKTIIKPTPNNSTVGNILCPRYPADAVNNMASVDKKVFVDTTGIVYIKDTTYTDAATFKTAMNNVYLLYEKAEASTETADPYQSPQICDPDGTEEYVTTGIPVGQNTEYPANLKGAIERIMVQVPKPPTANGTYSLKATVTASGVTYAWSS